MSNQPANGHKRLNFSDCMGMAVGQIIGSGIMVLTGIVIGLTGHGTPYAFIMGALLAIATCIPFIILTSTIPASGAGYTYPHRQERRPARCFSPCWLPPPAIWRHPAAWPAGSSSSFSPVLPR